jgi:hypothetical protein
MKTERLVLLVTPEEKARIGAGAAKLGVSVSEYVRKLVGLIDAEDVAELEGLAALMPALATAMANIEANIGHAVARFEEAEKERAYLYSDEYRAKVREGLLSDPTINWDAVEALFGGRKPNSGVAV